jgi:WD40 repeat protein
MGTLAQNLGRLSSEQRLHTLQSLPAYLAAAGKGQGLLRALTAFEFIQAKLTALGPAPLGADYDLASGAGLGLDDADVAGLRLIGDAVRLSAPVLAAQPTHLAAQLLARLSPADGPPPVAQVLEQAVAGPGGPWLRPLRPSLSRAGGPLRYVLGGHENRVRAIAITQDGKRAVSAADDRTLIVWDLANGTALFTLRGHTDQIYTVAVTHDGSLAVSGCNDRTLRVWDLGRGSVRRVLRGHEAYIKAVAVTADDALAISVAADRTIVWDMESGLPVVRRDGHGGYTSSLALLPDGRHALSPADDHSLRVWEVRTGVERSGGVLAGHTDNVNTIAVAPDGQRAVSGSQDGVLILWDLDQAAPLQSWKMDERGINQVAFLPGGQQIIGVGESSTVTIWDLDHGASIWQMQDGQEGIKAVAVSADGALALSAPFDSTVKVWNLPVVLSTSGQHEAPAPISSVACAGPYAFSQQGQALTAWDVDSAQERFALTGYRFVAAAPAMDRALLIS